MSIEIKQLPNETDYLYEQRLAAIHYLGKKWLLHPDNKREKQSAKKSVLSYPAV